MATFVVNSYGDDYVEKIYLAPPMDTLGERLKFARKAHSMTQRQLAEVLGIKRESIAAWEANEARPDMSRFPTLTTVFQTTFDWLMEGKGDPPKVRIVDRDGPVRIATVDQPRGGRVEIVGRTKGEPVSEVLQPYEGPAMHAGGPTVPVYAAAEGGKGHIIIEYERIEDARRPEELAGVRDGYGILIRGTSMVPAFRPGDVAWVNPHKVEEPDTEVVLYHTPPHGEPAEAMVKTLVSWNQREWKLRQYQPFREWSESRKDWPVCHRIVGKRSAK